MNISKVLEETEAFEMEWNGEKVSFEARKANLTPSFLKNLDDPKTYPGAIASALTTWDVTDGEDKMWPITTVELERLPVAFLSAVLGKIAESWGADKKKPQASASGSAAAGS